MRTLTLDRAEYELVMLAVREHADGIVNYSRWIDLAVNLPEREHVKTNLATENRACLEFIVRLLDIPVEPDVETAISPLDMTEGGK